jgi:ABC-type cobalamin/Fe3+-siderophores transport system ATPase subunit
MTDSISGKRKKFGTTADLKKISVSGYKSIKDRVEMWIAPVTLLAGANSSGKSSFLQPLLLLKQTIESQVDPGPILLHGANVRVSNFADIVSSIGRRGDKKSIDIELEVSTRIDYFKYSLSFGFEKKKLVARLSVKRGNSEPVLLEEGKKLEQEELERLVGEEAVFRGLLLNQQKTYDAVCKRDRFLFNVEFRRKDGSADARGIGRYKVYPETGGFGRYNVSSILQTLFERVYHVPALRGNPEPSYRAVGLGGKFPGTFDNYVASIINEWRQNDKEKLDELGALLAELGLTWKVSSKKIDDTQVQILVGRLQHPRQGGAKDLVNIVQVGFAVSQVLPILVALLVAQPGEIVYIEQPEIHLHPKAQVKLTALLVRFAAQNSIKIVIETHSSLVLTGIQTEVARGALSATDVSLNWFSRDDDGVTGVVAGRVEPDGSFGDWPEDFTEVELGASERFVKASSRHLTSPQKSN